MSPFSVIKQVRRAKKITQKQMAERLECNLKTYQRFERGEGQALLIKVCAALDITVLIINDENILNKA